MTTFMLLVLLQLSSGHYEPRMYAMPDMPTCLAQLPEIAKMIPKEPGLSYSLTCIQVKDTMEQPS